MVSRSITKMYVYIHVHVHNHEYVHIHVYVHIHEYVHIYVHIHGHQPVSWWAKKKSDGSKERASSYMWIYQFCI